MTSSICTLDGSMVSIAAALEETERFARRCGLAQKRLLHLRLLAEELIGMVSGVLDVKAGSFWLEREGMVYRFHLAARVQTGKAVRKLLLETASSGENEFYKGVTGKIRQAVDFLSQGDLDSIAVQGSVGGGFLPSEEEMAWSLTRYRQSLRQEEQAAAWDELEKSVLNRLADDILVGVRFDEVAITIFKIFC